MGWLDKGSAMRLIKFNPEFKEEILAIFKRENPYEKRRPGLIVHHCSKGPFFRCPGCKSIHKLTELLATTYGLIDPALKNLSTDTLLKRFRDTRLKYEQYVTFTLEEKYHRSNLQAAIIREVLSINECDIRQVPPGEQWSFLDVINNLIAEEEWNMNAGVSQSSRERNQIWERSLDRLRKLRANLLKYQKNQ
jgi:hypothetical protein